MKNKNFETAFAPASEVAQTLAGDCTEHGVLVAAMCRAVGVPARVVVGPGLLRSARRLRLPHVERGVRQPALGGVDAAFDQTDVDAVHVKLADAGLEGVSPYENFLSVVRVMGKMTLEPVEIR